MSKATRHNICYTSTLQYALFGLQILRHSRHQSTDKLKLIMTWSFTFPTAEGRFMCVCFDCLSVPCQHLRKCVENSMENMHIDVSVLVFYLFSYSFFSVKTGGKNCLF